VLPTRFNKLRPGFGCFAYGIDPITEREEMREVPPELNDKCVDNKHSKSKTKIWSPKFMYFVKYKEPPPEVQPMRKGGGDFYKMTIWWDRPQDPDPRIQKRKGGAPTDFFVYINADGSEIRVLRVLETAYHYAPRKRKHNGRKPNGVTVIPERGWHIPDEYESWARSHGIDVQTHLSHMFCDAARKIENQELSSMIRVAASKEDMTASFGVDIRRTAYFFKDRDIALTDTGTRRKVFHLVRPHVRGDGTVVKMHFRGEREFTWAGYDVKITVPGRDHLLLQEFTVPVEDPANVPDHDRCIGSKGVGQWLADNINQHRGGTHSAAPIDDFRKYK
jgi:hypothetical protein